MLSIRRLYRGLADLHHFFRGHPLTRDRIATAYWRLIRWQVASRLAANPIAVPFVNGTRLYVRRGMVGATGNVYAGLHEFPQMAFTLHFLRAGDLFADVGANVGSYTVLAAGVCHARTLAYEPIGPAMAALAENVRRNGIDHLVTPRRMALGAQTGTVRMTNGDDTMNRVVDGPAGETGTEAVDMATLDGEFAGEPPILVKVDAEGCDAEVVFGGSNLLRDDRLKALIVEFAGMGSREAEAHRLLAECRFRPCTYDPFQRRLVDLPDYADRTIYVRDPDFVGERLKSAPAFRVLDDVL